MVSAHPLQSIDVVTVAVLPYEVHFVLKAGSRKIVDVQLVAIDVDVDVGQSGQIIGDANASPTAAASARIAARMDMLLFVALRCDRLDTL